MFLFSQNQNSRCQLVMGKCLTDDLLDYLLESEEEKQHVGDFKQVFIYPSILFLGKGSLFILLTL